MKKSVLSISILLSLSSQLWAADKLIEPSMLTIKAGHFAMGSETSRSSRPVHQVDIKAFKLGKYEVTVKEFQQFVEATDYHAPQQCIQMAGNPWFDDLHGSWAGNTLTSSPYHPVTCIGWNAANAYVQWLAKETGKKYRLPTEAEWEYADRAGSQRKYSFGFNESLACRYGNIADRSAEAAFKRDYDGLESKDHVGVAPCDDKSDYASIVGMYEPNAFGLYDTLGNISEFVQDCMHDNYEGAPGDGSAWIDSECKQRVNRGGNWHWDAWSSASRGDMPSDFVGVLEGFRVAQDMEGDVASNASSAISISVTGISVTTRAFENELVAAQQREREKRSKRAEITPAP